MYSDTLLGHSRLMELFLTMSVDGYQGTKDKAIPRAINSSMLTYEEWVGPPMTDTITVCSININMCITVCHQL